MKVLLDTCTFLWISLDAPELSEHAREVFRDPDNEVYLSTVSAWEIAVKYGLGRLALPEPPDAYVPTLRADHAIESLALGEQAALHVQRLPVLHRDPFDRMLVCQAIVGGMILLTPDAAISQYSIHVQW